MKYDELVKKLGKRVFLFAPKKEEKTKKDHKQIKKLRVTDTLDTVRVSSYYPSQNKEIDLPIAMKYRNYREQPKKVDVGPSKIHRNGLFVLEE